MTQDMVLGALVPKLAFLWWFYPSISDTIAWKRKPPLCIPSAQQVARLRSGFERVRFNDEEHRGNICSNWDWIFGDAVRILDAD
jgi:hypothetical protein